MNWFRRKKKEEPARGSVTNGSVEIPLDLASLDLTHMMNMTNNVMWCRENLDAMLGYLAVHRDDEHDCPPFCIPRGIGVFLGKLEKDHLMMLLLVLMKDLEVSFVFEEPES